MIILIAITGMMLTGIIYLLCVPVHFEIGYNIEKNSLESGVIRLYPFTYQIRPKFGQDTGSGKFEGLIDAIPGVINKVKDIIPGKDKGRRIKEEKGKDKE